MEKTYSLMELHILIHLDVDENAGIVGNLTVSGNSVFNGNVDLGNASSDTVSFLGRVDTNIVPSTDGARDLGTSTLEWRNLFLDGTAHVDTLDVDANAGIVGNLTVTGTSEFNNTVDVDADFAVRNGTTDKFTIDNITGNAITSGTLTVGGHAELNSTLNVDGNTTLGGTLSVSSNTTLSANLTVNGNTTLGNASSDTVTIPGILDTNGRADIDNIRIDGNTISAQNADGSVNINGNGSGHINLNDDTDITGSLDLGGVLNANGNVNLGNATSDTITATGRFDSHLVPNTDDARDLGTSTLQWRNIYSDGTINADVLDVDNTADFNSSVTIAGLLDANGGAHIDNLRLGIDANNDITTSSGNLTLDSASGTVRVNDNLTVDGTISGNGSGLTTLNASNLSSGTVPLARLGSGTKNSTTFLAGDNTFRTVVVAINTLNNAGNNRIITSSGGSTANSESNLTFDGTTLQVAAGSNYVNSSNGHITATGNITAFASDIRLKTAIQPIENAVAKVLKLSGFTYELNELAGTLGYELTGERYSGVSAQEVKEVLPEAVKPAPINADYMTVQYDKLVPILIEAIKELKAEIDELKK